MKNPLHYQISEYDCGPTSMLNALSFLFSREELSPDLIRNIMLYSLDSYGPSAAPGKNGTSRMAMMFLSHWLQGFGKAGGLPVSSQYLRGNEVKIVSGSKIVESLHQGGVAVVRLYYEVAHYVLLTGEKDGYIYMFDPYYEEDSLDDVTVTITLAHPKEYNRIVPFKNFNRETKDTYSLGIIDEREAVLLFNNNNRLTADNTIEYFI